MNFCVRVYIQDDFRCCHKSYFHDTRFSFLSICISKTLHGVKTVEIIKYFVSTRIGLTCCQVQLLLSTPPTIKHICTLESIYIQHRANAIQCKRFQILTHVNSPQDISKRQLVVKKATVTTPTQLKKSHCLLMNVSSII